MPDIELDLCISAPIERVWSAIIDIERYPATMRNVRSTAVLAWNGPNERRCAWSVSLKGAILEWEERESFDHDRYVVRFEQLSGDMEIFHGHWALASTTDGLTRVTLHVTFEIGIPLLADMLNPVAQRSLHENCTEMLQGIESEALVG